MILITVFSNFKELIFFFSLNISDHVKIEFFHFPSTRFKHILQPIAEVCIAKEQQDCVDFDSFFTHTICHECCHGIGPHSITLPSGEKSTVRLVSCIIYPFNS